MSLSNGRRFVSYPALRILDSYCSLFCLYPRSIQSLTSPWPDSSACQISSANPLQLCESGEFDYSKGMFCCAQMPTTEEQARSTVNWRRCPRRMRGIQKGNNDAPLADVCSQVRNRSPFWPAASLIGRGSVIVSCTRTRLYVSKGLF